MNIGKENEYTEFKESLIQLDKGLRSITSMLNKHGTGSVYFGVDDNGNVIGGLSIGKNTYQDIRNKINSFIDPKIIYNLETLKSDDGLEYLKLSAEGYDMPYSYDGRYFIRNISSDEKVSNELLRKMLVSSSNDIIKNMPSIDQNLTFNQFCQYFATLGLYSPNNNDFFASKGLFNKENKFNLMAYLLSDQSQISIKVVKFEGKDKTSMSSRTEFGNKCLLYSVNDVLNYFKSINTTNVLLENGVRKEISLFNFEAFREAWINACLHNSWADMIPPSIFMYDDRIEILSYGGLPYGLSLDSFYSGLSKPVNLTLLGIFNSVGFSEQSGHGVPKIVNAYSKEAFNFDDNTIKVTIRFSFEPDFVIYRKKHNDFISKLTKNQRNVYESLKLDPDTTLAKIAKNYELSETGVKNIVLKLQELDLVEHIGSKRDGKWLVK